MNPFNTQFITDTTSKLAEKLATFSPNIMDAGAMADLKKNFSALLSAQLTKLNLITREEFDIQVALLAKAQAKLATLEAQVAALEKDAKTAPDTPQDPTG